NILKKDLIDSYFLRSQRGLEALHVDNKFLDLFNVVSEVDLLKLEGKPDFQNLIDDLLKLYGFDNIRIFDVNHHQLFSTSSTYLPSGIMERIDSIVQKNPDRLQIIDISPYVPSKETVVVYYVPVHDKEKKVGTVLVQENFQRIQEILFEITGMGSTGESYLAGSDFHMRSSSRFFPDTPPLTLKVKTEATRFAFVSSSGPTLIKDYRGIDVLSAYRRISTSDLSWVIISEIDFEEAMQPIIRLRNNLAGVTVALVIVTMLITIVLSNAIAQPILKLQKIIVSLSMGIIPREKLKVRSADEIGKITQAIQQLIDALDRTTSFAKEIGTGNFDTEFATLSDDDELGSSLKRMRDELKSYNEREVKLARERSAALMEGQEYERQRITLELHDGVGQLLTAIRIRIEMLEGNDRLKQELKSQINDTIAEIKRISYNVMPHALVDYGLEAALKGLCDNVGKYSPLTIDFRYIKEVDRKLTFEISSAVFRIVQEGLNNIVKHASASHVDLHVLDKEDSIYVILQDNGVGFSESAETFQYGSGLRNMKERARLLNGTTAVHSTPAEGTTIEVTIPI
ncbi:MAG TPA: ATP-binding protein, partial [Cyclobacteriaceae bacterium]|nr:ATP-binding protein [Cyclobacteriaceae bacterium]